MREPLLQDFFNHKGWNHSTYRTRRTYLNKNIIDAIVNRSIIEKNYIDIVAFSIDANRCDLANTLLCQISCKIGSRSHYSKNSATYKAIGTFNAYKLFIKGVTQSVVNNSLKNCSVYGYNFTSFKNNLKGRLRRQSRISGDKTWLPLDFLTKLYNKCGSQDFKKWIEYLFNKIHIILNINNANSHKPLKDIEYIGICRSGYVVALYNDDWYQVMTPNGYLNHKCEMKIFGDLRKIAIDHVTPIDSTLKSIKLPQLKIISDYIKKFKENNPQFSGNALEANAFSSPGVIIGTIVNINGKVVNIKSLTKELYDISNDSYYRLIDDNVNLQKSNLLAYIKFYKVNNTDYYGSIGKCKVNSHTDSIIYQNLKTNYISVIDLTQWNRLTKSKSPINTVDVPIDYL